MLTIAGSRIGSAGAIRSHFIYKAKNRCRFNVIGGGIGGDVAVAAGGAAEQCPIQSGSADDATLVLSNAETAVIVRG